MVRNRKLQGLAERTMMRMMRMTVVVVVVVVVVRVMMLVVVWSELRRSRFFGGFLNRRLAYLPLGVQRVV